MDECLTKGCGSLTTMGHGDNARCGEDYRNCGIFYCRQCLKKQNAVLTARIVELETLLKETETHPRAGPFHPTT